MATKRATPSTTLHCDLETLARLEQLQAMRYRTPKCRIVADLVKEALDRALAAAAVPIEGGSTSA